MSDTCNADSLYGDDPLSRLYKEQLMYLKTTYENALAAYPDAVNSVMDKIRKGKSKCRHDAPDSFEWGYDWSVQITRGVYNIHQVLQIASGQRQHDPEPEGVEAKVADIIPRISVCISAKKGRTTWLSAQRLPSVPPEIIAEYRKRFEEEEVEQRRIDALTPEQKDAELQDALGQLSRSPGFAAFGVRKI